MRYSEREFKRLKSFNDVERLLEELVEEKKLIYILSHEAPLDAIYKSKSSLIIGYTLYGGESKMFKCSIESLKKDWVVIDVE